MTSFSIVFFLPLTFLLQRSLSAVSNSFYLSSFLSYPTLSRSLLMQTPSQVRSSSPSFPSTLYIYIYILYRVCLVVGWPLQCKILASVTQTPRGGSTFQPSILLGVVTQPTDSRLSETSKILNMQRTQWYGINITGCSLTLLLVSCLKFRSIIILNYYVCLNHCHGLWRTAVT